MIMIKWRLFAIFVRIGGINYCGEKIIEEALD